MILVVTALMLEAAPLIEHYGLKKDMGSHPFPIYRRDDKCLVVSGTGKVRSAMAVASLMAKEKPPAREVLLVNIGFCGVRHSDIRPGSLVMAGKVIDMDTGRDYYPDIRPETGLSPVVLHCSSRRVCRADIGQYPAPDPAHPVHEPAWFDMESAGFMEAASLLVSPERILVLKAVSDHLEPGRLEKARLQCLMCEQLPVLDRILETVAPVQVYPDDLVIPPGLHLAVCRLSDQLRFTSAMQQQMEKAVRQAYLAGTDPLSLLQTHLNSNPQHKREGKKAFASLMQQLQP